MSQAHSSFCVSISSSGCQFSGAAQTTHSTALQSEGLFRQYLLIGICGIGWGVSAASAFKSLQFVIWQHAQVLLDEGVGLGKADDLFSQ